MITKPIYGPLEQFVTGKNFIAVRDPNPASTELKFFQHVAETILIAGTGEG